LGIGVFSFYKFFSFQTKPVDETPRTEMKKLPPDVKKELMRQAVKGTTSATFRVPILMYHYVEYVQDKKDTTRQSLNINPYVFEQQIKTLQNAGFTFMTAKELGDYIDGKRQLPKNPIILTFDDGHWDLDTVVLPILKKYNVKATAYIISEFIGKSDFMTQLQMQDVVKSGLVDIGAHTVHHLSLKGRLSSVVKYEIEQSKAMLESTYHISVDSFAYPGGAFDQQAINLAKDARFTTAVSTIPGIGQSQQNKFFLYRIRPGYRTGQALLSYLQQNRFRLY
jgi:peptidoglycan/xylan/chitin deacetylase (PgdA/CDA1 family)